VKKLIFSTVFIALSVLSSAQVRLKTYQDVLKSLMEGKPVRVAVDYKKTQLFYEGKEEKAPDAQGGLTIGNWENFAKGVIRNDKAYIAFSETHLITHPKHGYVNNYVRFRVYEDGTVEITARYLKTGTYEVVMDETFKSKISSGKDEFGVSFFRN
jgi:NADPH:quinone reductase-like Zn-dependent oxidoreductase